MRAIKLFRNEVRDGGTVCVPFKLSGLLIQPRGQCRNACIRDRQCRAELFDMLGKPRGAVQNLAVTIPGNATPGAYSDTLTYTIAAGVGA